jgi:hypothetical protein
MAKHQTLTPFFLSRLGTMEPPSSIRPFSIARVISVETRAPPPSLTIAAAICQLPATCVCRLSPGFIDEPLPLQPFGEHCNTQSTLGLAVVTPSSPLGS